MRHVKDEGARLQSFGKRHESGVRLVCQVTLRVDDVRRPAGGLLGSKCRAELFPHEACIFLYARVDVKAVRRAMQSRKMRELASEHQTPSYFGIEPVKPEHQKSLRSGRHRLGPFAVFSKVFVKPS